MSDIETNGIKLEYQGDNFTSAWTDQGTLDLLEDIAEVSWSIKSSLEFKMEYHAKLRPEAMSQRIDYIKQGIFWRCI